MLYIFAGFPRCGLNAGGVQYAVEYVETLGQLTHGAIQARREGMYILTDTGEERTGDTQYHMSDRCLADGITWDWFPANWAFGNGVTIHKTTALAEQATVVRGTELTLDDFLAQQGPTALASLSLERRHIETEGWLAYAARWEPGRCPRETHQVFLTWMLTDRELGEAAYNRVRHIIEEPGAELVDVGLYEDHHYSPTRQWEGRK